MSAAWKAAGLTYVLALSPSRQVRSESQLLIGSTSYNRYLAVAARAVRRSLKEGPRLQSERRGQMELKFSKWEVRTKIIRRGIGSRLTVCDRAERKAGRGPSAGRCQHRGHGSPS
jgi:hypothetical protein